MQESQVHLESGGTPQSKGKGKGKSSKGKGKSSKGKEKAGELHTCFCRGYNK